MKVFVASVLLSIMWPLACSADNLEAFPQADKGMVRYHLSLPEQTDESLYKVELIVGKILKADSVNRHFLSGKITSETIDGWGYTRYVVNSLGNMAGTLMAVNPDTPQVEQFIRLAGKPYLVPYNSRMPIVIYVPEDAEVRYRFWNAGVLQRLNQ